MSDIARSIRVSYELRVHFTRRVFDPTNGLLQDVLSDSSPRAARKALVVLDESLATAQPDLARQIEAWFASHAGAVKLVAPPLVIEGGERTKNSPSHVSEIHAQI